MTATMYDSQTGKLITGEVRNVTQYSFELVDEKGNVYRFPIDHLKLDK